MTRMLQQAKLFFQLYFILFTIKCQAKHKQMEDIISIVPKVFATLCTDINNPKKVGSTGLFAYLSKTNF